ncbi:hypothetical protein HK102_011117 [Quaeritorhiza haematococci]|nr:hypothetical protein HK102_011117 [Quaeritorhiza haematococci]
MTTTLPRPTNIKLTPHDKVCLTTIASVILTSTLFPALFDAYVGVSLQVLFLLVLAIPHGAIDHLVAYTTSTSTVTPTFFYAAYLGIMLAYGSLWYLSPAVSLSIFLGLTAYHFGEGDVAHLPIRGTLRALIRTSRGIFLLASILLAQPHRTAPTIDALLGIGEKPLSSSWNDVLTGPAGSMLYLYGTLQHALVLSGLWANPSLFSSSFTTRMTNEEAANLWIKELLRISVISVLCLSVDQLVAASLVMGVVHSLSHVQHMIAEFKRAGVYGFKPNDLSTKKTEGATSTSTSLEVEPYQVTMGDIGKFCELAAPYTLFSWLGMGFLTCVACMYWPEGFRSSLRDERFLWAVFGVSISILTAPHMVVVYFFYKHAESQ